MFSTFEKSIGKIVIEKCPRFWQISLEKCRRISLSPIRSFRFYNRCFSISSFSRFRSNVVGKFSKLEPCQSISCRIHQLQRPKVDSVRDALVSEFECSEEEAKAIAEKLSSHLSSEVDIIRSFEHLKNIGFDREYIHYLPNIPSYKSLYLSSAIKCIEQLHPNIKVVLPLICVHYRKLERIVERACPETEYYPEGGKIKWLSQLLQCDESLLCRKAALRPKVLLLPPKHIHDIVDVLKDGGIEQQYIVNDLKVLCFRKESLRLRLDVLKKHNMNNLRPWVLSATEENFQRAIERRLELRKIMGNYKNNLDYLTARLNCEEDRIQIILQKVPQVKYMTVTKLKSVLDFLYSEGYNPEDVCNMPRVLTRSLSTLKARVKELQELKCRHIYLSTICKTRKEYALYLKKIKNLP